MTKPRRQFTRDFKLDAVRRVTDGGQTQAQVARELELRPNLVYRWVRKYQRDGDQAFAASANAKAGGERLSQLMRENRRLREERDVLKKAVAILAG